MVEHWTHNPKVTDSNSVPATNFKKIIMNLYQVFSELDIDYDMYDGMIIAAKSKKRAVEIAFESGLRNQCSIKSTDLIGNAHSSIKEEKVLLASFNAG